jgi:hypothetical protein
VSAAPTPEQEAEHDVWTLLRDIALLEDQAAHWKKARDAADRHLHRIGAKLVVARTYLASLVDNR